MMGQENAIKCLTGSPIKSFVFHFATQKYKDYKSSCLHRASMITKHFIIQLMHSIYVYTIKIIKYLKVLQHVSDHRGSIIRDPCTVHG